jgi:SET domain-containing protein
MERKFFGEPYIMMPKARFIKEHENLLKILDKGDPKELKKEAEEQKKELESYTTTGGKKLGEYLPPPTFKSDLVEAKKSKTHGRGLFAKVDIPKGTRIADYVGDEMTIKEYKEKYGDDLRYSYLMRRTHKILDGKPKKYLSKNASHYINEGKPINVVFKNRGVVASRNIKAGQELFVKYAKDYPRDW